MGPGTYGARTGSSSQINPAVLGAMILAQLALQRFQERRQRRHQRYKMVNYRRSRHSRCFDPGNPAPFGYGF
jgi:hypothetical protein